jgi:hypothetical protein
MPKVTCGRITLWLPSATALSISTPRLMGPGCMTMQSGLASASFSGVRPKLLKNSPALGSMAPLMRSFCSRSMMMTSAPRMPSAMSWHTRTPIAARSPGTSVLGPTARISGTPSVVSAWMSLRATRLCTMSPTMATVRLLKSFLKWRMVYMSSSPCVGWACRPSPALTTCTCGATCCAMR